MFLPVNIIFSGIFGGGKGEVFVQPGHSFQPSFALIGRAVGVSPAEVSRSREPFFPDQFVGAEGGELVFRVNEIKPGLEGVGQCGLAVVGISGGFRQNFGFAMQVVAVAAGDVPVIPMQPEQLVACARVHDVQLGEAVAFVDEGIVIGDGPLAGMIEIVVLNAGEMVTGEEV